MAIVLNPQPTWQEALGSGLGQGISTGVQSLIKNKMSQMAKEQEGNQRLNALQGLKKSGLLGEQFTPEALQQLKHLDPTTLNTIIKQQMQAPQNAAYAQALQGILGGEGVGELPAGVTAQQAGQLAEIGLKKQKQISASQEKIKPFLDAHYADVKSAKLIRQKAKSALDILQKHKDKFPKGILSYAPESFFRDPDVRKYAADLNSLVKLSAGATKGAVTNLKIRLEQLAKANLNQPIETQEQILKEFIEAADSVDSETEEIERLRKENKGIYPEDISQKMSVFENREKPQIQQGKGIIKPGESVVSVPANERPLGQKAINSKTNETFYWDGQDWVTEKEWNAKGA